MSTTVQPFSHNLVLLFRNHGSVSCWQTPGRALWAPTAESSQPPHAVAGLAPGPRSLQPENCVSDIRSRDQRLWKDYLAVTGRKGNMARRNPEWWKSPPQPSWHRLNPGALAFISQKCSTVMTRLWRTSELFYTWCMQNTSKITPWECLITPQI